MIGGTYVEFPIFLFIIDCYQVYSTQEIFYILNLMVAMKLHTTHTLRTMKLVLVRLSAWPRRYMQLCTFKVVVVMKLSP